MEETSRFLIMTLADETFAIPITSLLEITTPRNIQRDPNLSEIFEGKYEYRGRMIPVVNLRKVLKMPGNAGASLIVTRCAKGIIGLLVDGAKELLDTREKPQPLPAGVVNPGLNYYAGVLRSGDELVLLLNEDGLVP